MCGIAGFAALRQGCGYLNAPEKHHARLRAMSASLQRRGPDESGLYLTDWAGLAHARLSIIDLERGKQPMVRSSGGCEFAISYNGELYNTAELRSELQAKGWKFQTHSDTEVILVGYMQYGAQIAEHLNGIFAFAIADGRENALCLFRDRMGVKPLFYARTPEEVLFASELKGLFAGGIQPKIDRQGLNEIFSIGPAKTPGCGVFAGVEEVLPGHWVRIRPEGVQQYQYWKLESRPHEDGWDKTVETTGFLVRDAIRRQMISDVPVCTFLSGGVDSSLVTAVCAQELKKQGKQLTTFSFDFVDNSRYFKAIDFQPSRDRPYVEQMAAFLGTDHHFLECGNEDMIECLYKAVDAKDLPGMADVDASMLYFCSVVKGYNKVVLTGECADEIFGGYPWFHKAEFQKRDAFPWSPSAEPRKALLKDSLIGELDMDGYIRQRYEESVAQTPYLPGEDEEQRRRRQISWLNLRWFMQTLLDRMDRTSMYSGLEARVPFADHRIVEYLWNVPWEMKAKGGVVKGLLREAGRGLVPDEVLFRRKSPYPKTYDPAYEGKLKQRLAELIEEGSAPVLELIDREKTKKFLASPSDYGKPWFGQLMAGPQMVAYCLQINDWMEKYKVEII